MRSRVRLRDDASRACIEPPRVTKPYTDDQWRAIETLGDKIDAVLAAGDVRLTMGGEPTFVSIDDMEGAEWNTAAVGPTKRALRRHADPPLARPLRAGRPAALRPGQMVSRREPAALGVRALLARRRAAAVARSATASRPSAANYAPTADDARELAQRHRAAARPQSRLRDAGLRRPLALSRQGAGACRSMSIRSIPSSKIPKSARGLRACSSAAWASPSASCCRCSAGTRRPAPLALRALADAQRPSVAGAGRFAGRIPPAAGIPALDSAGAARLRAAARPVRRLCRRFPNADYLSPALSVRNDARSVMASAPPRASNSEAPTERRERAHGADRRAARRPALRVHAADRNGGGLSRPARRDRRCRGRARRRRCTSKAIRRPTIRGINVIKVTPDPGVIEVNIHPGEELARSGRDHDRALRGSAAIAARHREIHARWPPHRHRRRQPHRASARATPADSPFLRRPDLLKSLVAYWQNHPSLSYLFSGMFIGPTSQAPRIDEARHDGLYELEIAFERSSRPRRKPRRRPGWSTASSAIC